MRALATIRHYFDTIGLPIVGGRPFAATDVIGSPRVAIINEHLAQVYWGGTSPIGQRLRFADDAELPLEIVGVAKTAKYVALTESPIGVVYLPYWQ